MNEKYQTNETLFLLASFATGISLGFAIISIIELLAEMNQETTFQDYLGAIVLAASVAIPFALFFFPL